MDQTAFSLRVQWKRRFPVYYDPYQDGDQRDRFGVVPKQKNPIQKKTEMVLEVLTSKLQPQQPSG